MFSNTYKERILFPRQSHLPREQHQAQGKRGIAYADPNGKAAVGPKATQLKLDYADIGQWSKKEYAAQR